MSLYDTTIICAYQASQPFETKRLLDADVAEVVAREVLQQCRGSETTQDEEVGEEPIIIDIK